MERLRFQEAVADLQRTSLELQNTISKQFSELMAALNRSRDDKWCDDRSTLDRYSPSSQKVKGNGSEGLERSRADRRTEENLQVDALPYSSQISDSSGFNRPDPKPIYEIKADKRIPKASSTSKRRSKLQKRISCEELDERMMKGLCVFCEEPETPDHYLQHMDSGILMIDSEDHLSDSREISSDRWLSNSIGCESEIDETDNDEDRVPSDSDLVVNDIEKESKLEVVTDKKESMEVDTSEVEHKTESGRRAEEPPKSAADEVHVQSIELMVRDQAQEASSDVVSSPGVNDKRDGAVETQTCISRLANHVWKPGELEQVMVIDDVVSLGKHVNLSDCVALPLIKPSSSVLKVFSHANRSVWEPGGFQWVQVQENCVQHERNKAEGVEFFVQRIGVASEMENQTVTAVVVYDKRSDRVWEPGGLPTKLNMWDWTEQHPRQGDVFEFESDLLEEIIQQDENPERQQVRKLKLSPKPWLFKFKQKLIRLKLRDKEFQIAMPLAPKILKVHHMLNSLVIAEAAAPIYSTIEYLSQFASKVGIDKEHSTSSLKVKKHDNLSWKEDESGSICCILKLGGVAITCKNVLEKIYAENLEIMACRLRPAMMESSVPSKVIGRDGSKRHGRSEIFCEVDAFGNQESSKFQKFAVAFRDISTVAKTQGLGFVHVLHKDAVLDSKLGYLIGNMREEDQKQQGDSELLVIVLECVDAKGGVGMDKKPFHLSFRNHRVWDPGGCISGLSRFC